MEGQKAIALGKSGTSKGLLTHIRGNHELYLFKDFTASRDSLLKGLDGAPLLPASSELSSHHALGYTFGYTALVEGKVQTVPGTQRRV